MQHSVDARDSFYFRSDAPRFTRNASTASLQQHRLFFSFLSLCLPLYNNYTLIIKLEKIRLEWNEMSADK